MIRLLRLDERLIHGQIAIKWSRHTNVTNIVVANDSAAANKIIQKSLLMAAPGHIKTVIKSMDDAIKLLNDPRCEALSILVIVKTPDDLLRIMETCPGIQNVNLGNYGRVELEKEGYPRKTFGSNLYADEFEVATLKKCCALHKIVYQTTPEQNAVDLEGLLNK